MNSLSHCFFVAICTERVEAKECAGWPAERGHVAICTERVEAKTDKRGKSKRERCCNLHGACGGKGIRGRGTAPRLSVAICTERVEAKIYQCYKVVIQVMLQSARSVWRQRCTSISSVLLINRCNLHGACGGKDADISLHFSFPRCNLHGACGGKVVLLGAYNTFYTLQSARGVWKTLHHPPEKNPRKFMQTYCIFIHLAV